MDLSTELRKYLLDNGATEVGFADMSEVTILKGLNTGVVFYIAYPKDILKRMDDAPTMEYVLKLVEMNKELDKLGMLSEEYLKNKGFDAYAQTKIRLGTDFGDDNSFELPHKTFATKAGLGWIGKSALLITEKYGSAIRLSSVLTNAPLETATPITESKCGECNLCQRACKAGAISGKNWNYLSKRNDFYDDKKCEKYMLKITEKKFGKPDTVCGKCIHACIYTKRYYQSKN